MKLPDYILVNSDLHDTCYKSIDGWWRYKDEWDWKRCSGNGEAMFQNLYLNTPRNCFNLIFSYDFNRTTREIRK